MLPYAREVVCREQGSYEIAKKYTDRVVLYHDWAIDVLEQDKNKGRGLSEKEPEKSDKWRIWCKDIAVGVSDNRDAMLKSNQKVPYFKHIQWAVAVCDDAPTHKREWVLCIVKNVVTGCFLAIRFANWSIVPAVWGWIDEWENIDRAARREILEESGIWELSLITDLWVIHDHFYSPHKNQNSYTTYHILYYETNQSDFESRSEEEQQIQNPLRIPASEIDQYNQRFDIRYCYELLSGDVKVFPTSYLRFNDMAIVPYFKYTDETWWVKNDVETKLRRTIQAIIRDRQTDQYLMLRWNIDSMISLVGWGVEEWETELEALHKEIKEEAWFDTIEIKRQVGWEIHRHFYHALKGYNNYTTTTCYYVEVDRDEQWDIDPEELTKHQPVRLTKDEILWQQNNVDPDNVYNFKLYLGEEVQPWGWTNAIAMNNNFVWGRIFKRADYWSAPTLYVLINFIPKHTTPEIITQFHKWIKDHPDHQIINFPAEEWDILPEEIMTQYWDRIQTWKRWERSVDETLQLYQQTQAWFGQRLHFIIPCIYYHIPMYRLAYSEKVNKILQYFDSKELYYKRN